MVDPPSLASLAYVRGLFFGWFDCERPSLFREAIFEIVRGYHKTGLKTSLETICKWFDAHRFGKYSLMFSI